MAEKLLKQTVWSVTGPLADLQKSADESYILESLVGVEVSEKGLLGMATFLHVFHVVTQKSDVELLHRTGVVRGVSLTVYSSPE